MEYKCICGEDGEHTIDCAVYNSGYKAGEVEGYKQGLEMREPYQAGIREVVEFVELHKSYYGESASKIVFEMGQEEWQAFKKRKLKE